MKNSIKKPNLKPNFLLSFVLRERSKRLTGVWMVVLIISTLSFNLNMSYALSFVRVSGLSMLIQVDSLQDAELKGTVKDESGEVISNVTVRVKGTSEVTLTDGEGSFSVRIDEFPAEIELSSMGYEKQLIVVTSSANVEVFLKASVSQVEEVIVIGYGETRKKDLTGSVVNVKMKDIEHQPVLSVDLALQGRVPGADFLASTGEPGANTTIRIRGTRSITATNEPLIVVDGVIDGVQSLTDINSDDIESISVLKDASATAIYGSRGSNGVIIITTKKGAKGKPRISLRSTLGLSQLPRELDIMNGMQYAQYRNDFAFFATSDNYGEIDEYTPLSKYPYPDPYGLGERTNWTREITRNAPYHTQDLSISGGDEKTSYYASIGYDNNQGIIEKSSLKRLTGRINLDYQLFPWMKLGYKYSFNKRDENKNLVTIGGANWWSGSIFLNPLIKIHDNFNDLWYSGQKFNSPRAVLDLRVVNNIKRDGATNTLSIDIAPLEGLTLNSQINYYSYNGHYFQFDPGIMPAKAEGEGARAYRQELNSTNLMSQSTANYKMNVGGKQFMDFTVGFIGQKQTTNDFSLSGTGYQSDYIKWNNMNAIPDKENYNAGTNNYSKTSLSYLARANYRYDDRYYFTITGRRDGASNFAANNKWAFFPSAAFKWTVSNEGFMKAVKWINEFSIRASAGRTGNDGIALYRSLSSLGSTTNGYLFGGSQPVAFYPSRLASENLTWEKTDMYNIATDISLLDERISVTLEAYQSYTSDLLLNVQVPQHTGYNTRLVNIGKTSNKGIEFSIETQNVKKQNFSWSSSFSISHNSQLVEDVGTVDYVPVYSGNSNNSYMMYGYVAGHPLNALWGFQYGGPWKSEDEITRNEVTKGYVSSAPAMYTLGAPRYYDINHDGVLDENDLIYLGNADPFVYGGLQNNFNFKNFYFSVFVNYSWKGSIYNISEQWMAGGQNTNQYTYMLNAWHPLRNPDSSLPRAGAVDNIASDRMVYDASYIRLKTLALGYTWDTRKIFNNVIENIQITFSGENLLLWKKYNGFDPDVSSEGGSSTFRRADIGAYPKPRTYVGSVKFSF